MGRSITLSELKVLRVPGYSLQCVMSIVWRHIPFKIKALEIYLMLNTNTQYVLLCKECRESNRNAGESEQWIRLTIEFLN
jgi:hypothetical protein